MFKPFHLGAGRSGPQLALLALLSFAGFAQPAFSQTQTGTSQAATAQAVASFKASPELLLAQFPNGGPELITRARELAVGDPTALDPLVALLAKATVDQKKAIAAGLGQARLIVFRSNREYSDLIARGIAETRDLDGVASFAAAAGDTGTAATGAAGAGSAGASGGQTSGLGQSGGAGGSVEGINGNSVNTGLFSFTSSVSGTGSSTNSAVTTTTTTTVSP